MLVGNVFTMMGLVGMLFSGSGGGINIASLAAGSFFVIIGVLVAFNEIKFNELKFSKNNFEA